MAFSITNQRARENRNYVTPYSFDVAQSLLGLRLAGPTKRLSAIAVDGMIVGMLATVDATFLGILVLIVSVVALYKMRGQAGRRFAKVSLYLIAFVSLLLLALETKPVQSSINRWFDASVVVVEDDSTDKANLVYQNESVSPEFELAVAELATAEGEVLCAEQTTCGQRFFTQLVDDVAAQGYSKNDAKLIYGGMKELLDDNDRLSDQMDDLGFESFLYEAHLATKGLGAKTAYSIVRATNALVDDLGLSFGWAALYFSVFIAWWEGQTLGKLLFGIRVVKIDGTQLDLWESFERYGGYGAGVATGLLGFLQVFWASNRQAIHDKISETVVVDLRKAPLAKEKAPLANKSSASKIESAAG